MRRERKLLAACEPYAQIVEMQVVLDKLLSGRAMQAAWKAAAAAQGGSRVTGASHHLARLLPQARSSSILLL